jgi:hypothetical protein
VSPELQSEAESGHLILPAAAIDVAETNVKSAEEILVGNGRRFDSMNEEEAALYRRNKSSPNPFTVAAAIENRNQ